VYLFYNFNLIYLYMCIMIFVCELETTMMTRGGGVGEKLGQDTQICVRVGVQGEGDVPSPSFTFDT
jgi:hypothetical protein